MTGRADHAIRVEARVLMVGDRIGTAAQGADRYDLPIAFHLRFMLGPDK
jgi:hypothetical protein